MQINKMVGYMLGNSSHVVGRGEQWCDAGIQVFVCANQDTARAILDASQKESLEPHIVWTTVYRVQAKNINVDKFENDLMWTTQGDKIFVDGPVMYREPEIMTEQRLLQNARLIRPHFSRLINNNKRKER